MSTTDLILIELKALFALVLGLIQGSMEAIPEAIKMSIVLHGVHWDALSDIGQVILDTKQSHNVFAQCWDLQSRKSRGE